LDALSSSTELGQIPIPFWETLLAEKFLLPADALKRLGIAVPKTLQDISILTGRSLDSVVETIQRCLMIDQLIWLEGQLTDHLGGEDCWLVDMTPYGIDDDREPLHEQAKAFHRGHPAAQLEAMRCLERVIILHQSPAQAWSAALALREMNIAAFILKTAWHRR